MNNNFISLVPTKKYYSTCAVFNTYNSYLDDYKRILEFNYIERKCELKGFGYNPLQSDDFLGDFFFYLEKKDFNLKTIFHYINSRGSPLKNYMHSHNVTHLIFTNFIIVINPKDNIVLL